MSRPQRLDMIDRDHPHLSLSRQCQLLVLSRSSLYSSPVPAEDLELMRRLDEQYLKTPFYGTRRMTQHLHRRAAPAQFDTNGRWRWRWRRGFASQVQGG